MSRPIDTIRAAGLKDWQRESNYMVDVFGPPKVGSIPFAGLSHTFVKECTLPGRNTATSEIKYGGGLTRKNVYNTIFNECTTTFQCDGSMDLLRYFHKWQNAIQNPFTGQVGYPDDYSGGVEIKLLNRTGLTVHTHKLIAAYPENVSDVQLSYASDSIATFTVTWAYLRYETGVEAGLPGQAGTPTNTRFSLGGFGFNFSIGPFSGRIGI